jgi:hypothetical protein
MVSAVPAPSVPSLISWRIIAASTGGREKPYRRTSGSGVHRAKRQNGGSGRSWAGRNGNSRNRIQKPKR